MKIFVVLFALTILSCGHADGDKTHSIPLTITHTPFMTMLKQNIHPKVVEAMVEAEVRNAGSSPIPLMRYMDSDFYGEVMIGQPGQKMLMSFDTAWEDSWVPSTHCSIFTPACARRSKFDPSKSKTAQETRKTLNVMFGSSALSGPIYRDVVKVNQINITNQEFAAVTDIPWIFVYSYYDGIVGMGCAPNEKIKPMMWNLKKQDKIDRMIFSFYFNKTSGSGSLDLGGANHRHYRGNITYVDLVRSNPPLWMVPVKNITLITHDQKTIGMCKSGCKAILSTGGNTITAPASTIEEINRAIKAKSFAMGRFTVPCSSVEHLPNITFSIEDKEFTLNGIDYVHKLTILKVPFCFSSFKINDYPDDTNWYLGGAFMSKYYTTFEMDRNRIGFAEARV